MKINLANIKKAKKLLYKRECIAIPTETVYGLAGNAYSDQACQKIYKLKKRPKNNPLIVHYLNIQRLKKDCHLNNDFIKLYKKFCPGPLTFILNLKKSIKNFKNNYQQKKYIGSKISAALSHEEITKNFGISFSSSKC